MAMSDISDDLSAPPTVPTAAVPPPNGTPQQLDVAQLLQALIQLMQNQSVSTPTGSQCPLPSGADGPPRFRKKNVRLDETYFE